MKFGNIADEPAKGACTDCDDFENILIHLSNGYILNNKWKGEDMYQAIDQINTGIRLKTLIMMAGYDVKDIQEYLYLSCPQPVYRWFKGNILPSVEHLYALSQLLHVHMEDLLVLQGQPVKDGMGVWVQEAATARLLNYRKRMRKAA